MVVVLRIILFRMVAVARVDTILVTILKVRMVVCDSAGGRELALFLVVMLVLRLVFVIILVVILVKEVVLFGLLNFGSCQVSCCWVWFFWWLSC